jgi:hypothetical protein
MPHAASPAFGNRENPPIDFDRFRLGIEPMRIAAAKSANNRTGELKHA